MFSLDRGGTRLATIAHHTLWLDCTCGRSAPLAVRDLLGRAELVTVADVVARARCAACWARRVKAVTISFEGGSAEAMRGALATRAGEG
ncbi:MAG: hypothetical protein KDK24_06965 [Pseudooceanicola sp.]|nr:hypothetical protein [Pseudooceanicola sp.]